MTDQPTLTGPVQIGSVDRNRRFMIMPEDLTRMAEIRDLSDQVASLWSKLSPDAQFFCFDAYGQQSVLAMSGRNCAAEAVEFICKARPEMVFYRVEAAGEEHRPDGVDKGYRELTPEERQALKVGDIICWKNPGEDHDDDDIEDWFIEEIDHAAGTCVVRWNNPSGKNGVDQYFNEEALIDDLRLQNETPSEKPQCAQSRMNKPRAA